MEGIESLLSKLNSISDIDNDLYKIMDTCGKFVADDARLRVPVDTGDLRKSIQHMTQKAESGISSVVYTNSDHAVYVEFGTGPVGAANHVGISPNAAPMYSTKKWRGMIPFLKTDTDAGIRYIAGQRAQPYLYPALKDNEEQLSAYMKSEISKAVRRTLNG
ncbi:MAG: HK97-gp10 family putative phage morphogenesis protein [Acetatifactor sp.]